MKEKIIPTMTAQNQAETNESCCLLPASFAQASLFERETVLPTPGLYHFASLLRWRGSLAPDALAKALIHLTVRHETLRTDFRMHEGHVCQRLHAELAPDFAELATVADAEFPARLATIFRKPFDLGCGPLLRTRLLPLDSGDTLIFICMHGAVTDCISMRILEGEIQELLGGADPAKLPALPIQFADVAHWQREQWSNPQLLIQAVERLRNATPQLALRHDELHSPQSNHRGHLLPVRLPNDLWGDLKALAVLERVTPFMVLLASTQILVARLSGQEDVVIGVLVAGRTKSETEGVLGPFTNTIPVRVRCPVGATFRTFLQMVREATLEAMAYQELPFDLLLETLRPSRSAGAHPLFQISITLQDFPHHRGGNSKDLRREFFHGGFARLDLAFAFREGANGLEGDLEYDTDLFKASTAQRASDLLQQVLQEMSANPDATMDTLPALQMDERRSLGPLLKHKTITNAMTLHGAFEAQAARTPNNIALIQAGRTLAYRELNARANQVAQDLRNRGIGPGSRVAIGTGFRLEMVVAMLGALKAGAAWFYVDRERPRGWAATSLSLLRLAKAAFSMFLPIADLSLVFLVKRNRKSFRGWNGPKVFLDVDRVIDETVFSDNTHSVKDASLAIVHLHAPSGAREQSWSHRDLLGLMEYQHGPQEHSLHTILLAPPLEWGGYWSLWTPLVRGGHCAMVGPDQGLPHIPHITPPPFRQLSANNATEAMLIEIWEEVLGVRPVGTHDHFFDLGGDSLLVLKMLNRVEQVLHWRPPLFLLYQKPTIAALCQAFLFVAQEKSLQEVQAGEGTPWFFLHGDYNGGGVYCRRLARLLGAAQPFHAIHPHGAAGLPLRDTVAAMAADYLQLVRSVQPRGPYLLGGYCNSAVIAFELARQLEDAGERVAALAMVAAPLKPPHPRPNQAMPHAHLSCEADRTRAFQLALQVSTAAVATYEPEPLGIPVVLLRPSDIDKQCHGRDSGWRTVLADLEVFDIQGNHHTAITTCAEDLASRLRDFMARRVL